MTIDKRCPICDSKLLLKFDIKSKSDPHYIFDCNNLSHGLVSFSVKKLYGNQELYSFVDTSGKGFGYYIFKHRKELKEDEKKELDNVIKLKMYEILKHYVECRVGSCYSTIFKYLLIPYLSDVNVLSAFLKSKCIKEFGAQPIMKSVNGEKIYYNLYYDFMLVNSEAIREFLSKAFPKYYNDFWEDIIPDERYSFVGYKNKKVIYKDDELE